jgi:hypothetical protein
MTNALTSFAAIGALSIYPARELPVATGSAGSRPGIAGIGRHGTPRGSGSSSMTRSFRSTRICIRIDPEVTQRDRNLDA